MKKIISLTLIVLFNVIGHAMPTKNIDNCIKDAIDTDIKTNTNPTLKKIYDTQKNQPLWIGKDEQIEKLTESLSNPFFNYKNKKFNIDTIKRLSLLLENDNLPLESRNKISAILDISLTHSYLSLIKFIVQGDIDWKLVQQKLKALKRTNDINAVWEMELKPLPHEDAITNSVKNNEIEVFLSSLIPMEERYAKLIKMLIDYKNMEEFPKIQYTKDTLKIGDNSRRVKKIKKRLQITGDYPAYLTINNNFDNDLKKAVVQFQKRHLVKPTGIIGRTSTYYLNNPVENKIKSIITNLDKTKLYPKEFEEEHVEINIPEFKLKYYKDRKNCLKKNVIVGRTDRPTPIFSDILEYMVLNPTWTIPTNLVKRDLIPAIKRDPTYLKNKNIHAFIEGEETEVDIDKLAEFEKGNAKLEYKFVQFAGKNNALGQVKFMFPNKHAVYLHDTNNKSLFSRRYKIFSSGCMRVEKPFELVDTLLKNTWKEYPKEKIEKITKTNKPTNIGFKKRVPVHVLYFTIYENEGRPYFINDFYLYDKIIEQSAEGEKIATFSVPKNRIVSVKRAH